MSKYFTLLLFLSSSLLPAQSPGTYVDETGVLRWTSSEEEVRGFGVNYTVPFAHAWRSAEKMGVDPREAIRNDVYHFDRLGFDLYRVHVWDTEISDSLGNLLENEHLNTYDYLIHELKKRGINYILTPIAFWGNGWPEPDEETPGFSHKYGKDASLTNPEAIRAQQRYLQQFMEHVNPYTGLAYKDDPSVVAVEVSNEPHHRGEPEDVQRFVEGMVEAIRRSGSEQPVFYNVSHGVHFMESYFSAGIQGGTFQWYPTGLGYQRELSGNFLPNVNEYRIPFDSTIKKYGGAKLVYEFDAADVGKSYIYPAMARSFREAGIQIATHFTYDPTYLAPYNTEYNTHYMNLAYTPRKALSLMISSRVFHEVPLGEDLGSFPENNEFGPFTVSYSEDLATYSTATHFYYTGSHEKEPVNRRRLRHIAGYGHSPVVNYSGKGAYFLDRMERGIWRLELMPDAISVSNPFGRNSLDKEVTIIKWNSHRMQVNLEDLGPEFTAQSVENPDIQTIAENGSVQLRPGVYLLKASGKRFSWNPEDSFLGNPVNAFYAPGDYAGELKFQLDYPEEWTAQHALPVNVIAVAGREIATVRLSGYGTAGWFNVDLRETSAHVYAGEIPADHIQPGYLDFYVIINYADGAAHTFPADRPGLPFEWDFYDRSTYSVRVNNIDRPVYLFEATKDADKLVRRWSPDSRLVPTAESGQDEYQVRVAQLYCPDPENLHADPVYQYSIRHFVMDKLRQPANYEAKSRIVLKGRALEAETEKLEVALLMEDGTAWGTVIELGAEMEEHRIPLSSLRPVRTVLQPRPYPTFLPYYFTHDMASDFDLSRVESIQLSVGPGLSEEEKRASHAIGIVWVSLE